MVFNIKTYHVSINDDILKQLNLIILKKSTTTFGTTTFGTTTSYVSIIIFFFELSVMRPVGHLELSTVIS